jgi:hypothetical protein
MHSQGRPDAVCRSRGRQLPIQVKNLITKTGRFGSLVPMVHSGHMVYTSFRTHV